MSVHQPRFTSCHAPRPAADKHKYSHYMYRHLVIARAEDSAPRHFADRRPWYGTPVDGARRRTGLCQTRLFQYRKCSQSRDSPGALLLLCFSSTLVPVQEAEFLFVRAVCSMWCQEQTPHKPRRAKRIISVYETELAIELVHSRHTIAFGASRACVFSAIA